MAQGLTQARQPYPLDQAEEDTTEARGNVDILGEQHTMVDWNGFEGPPNAPTGGHLKFSRNGSPRIISGGTGDTNEYTYAKFTAHITAQTISSTTFATLASATVGGSIGFSYRIKAIVPYTNSVGAGPPDFKLSLPAVTTDWFLIYKNSSISAGAVSLTSAVATTTTQVFTGGNSSTAAQYMEMEARFTFSASGTISLLCAEHVNTDTVAIAAGEFSVEIVN